MINIKIAIIGLGYVNVPLDVEFSKKVSSLIEPCKRVSGGNDKTREIDIASLKEVLSLRAEKIFR